jgi:hypothetical protein
MSVWDQTPKSISAALMSHLAPRADIAEFTKRVSSGPIAEVTSFIVGLVDFRSAHFNPDGKEKEISIRLG